MGQVHKKCLFWACSMTRVWSLNLAALPEPWLVVLYGTQSIRLPQMVKRSISNKSFLGLLCSSPSPSSPVLTLIIFSSSSSGVVRNVSESFLESVGAELSAMPVSWGLSDASDIPPLSVAGSVWKRVVQLIISCRGRCMHSTTDIHSPPSTKEQMSNHSLATIALHADAVKMIHSFSIG